jgi:hypothetical protein
VPDPIDILGTIAEIAITLAGFTGLIAVFRPHRPWSEQEIARLQTIVAACFACMISALLPFGLVGYTDRPSVLWGLPLGAFAILHIGILSYLYLRYRQRRFRPSGLVSRVVLSANGLFSVTLLLAASGVLIEPSAGLLVLACTWGIVFPAIGFALTFVVATKGADDAA